MRPSVALARHKAAVLALAARHGLSNVRVFGSVARNEDTDHSDLDLLVDAAPDTTLLEIVAMKRDAQGLLGVDVDVKTIDAIHERFRPRVLREAQRL